MQHEWNRPDHRILHEQMWIGQESHCDDERVGRSSIQSSIDSAMRKGNRDQSHRKYPDGVGDRVDVVLLACHHPRQSTPYVQHVAGCSGSPEHLKVPDLADVIEPDGKAEPRRRQRHE